MFEQLSQMLVRLVELFEAEGRLLRVHVVRTSMLVFFALGAVLIGVAGVVFLLAGLYSAMVERLGATWTAVIVGAVAVIVALVVLLQVRRSAR